LTKQLPAENDAGNSHIAQRGREQIRALRRAEGICIHQENCRCDTAPAEMPKWIKPITLCGWRDNNQAGLAGERWAGALEKLRERRAVRFEHSQ
jgi:hypothetical protein